MRAVVGVLRVPGGHRGVVDRDLKQRHGTSEKRGREVLRQHLLRRDLNPAIARRTGVPVGGLCRGIGIGVGEQDFERLQLVCGVGCGRRSRKAHRAHRRNDPGAPGSGTRLNLGEDNWSGKKGNDDKSM